MTRLKYILAVLVCFMLLMSADCEEPIFSSWESEDGYSATFFGGSFRLTDAAGETLVSSSYTTRTRLLGGTAVTLESSELNGNRGRITGIIMKDDLLTIHMMLTGASVMSTSLDLYPVTAYADFEGIWANGLDLSDFFEIADRRIYFYSGEACIAESYFALCVFNHDRSTDMYLVPGESVGFMLKITPDGQFIKKSDPLEEDSPDDIIYYYQNYNDSPEDPDGPVDYKPVIYLYPEKPTEVCIQLLLDGTLTCTYPKSSGVWNVSAAPDGTLTDSVGIEYNYLYWEGITNAAYDLSSGFCVKGSDTAAFLEDALDALGLTRREANEFIVYWLPLMECNPYNLISFQHEAYTESAVLNVTPAPDTVLRVFMAFKACDEPVEIAAQELTHTNRTGFTVVEWGGTQIK